MRRLRSAFPLVVLTLLALPALWPWLHPGLPRTNDALPHLYRAVQLDAVVGQGIFLPRWAPDLVWGYGYPVFNFFPFLSHYLVVGLHRLGLDFLPAYQAAGALTLWLTAWTAFAFGRDLFGEPAGLAAGVAYLYSPYILYDTYIRGSLPESLALALLPLAFLHLRRAARGAARSVAWAALAIAGGLLAHNGVSLQVMPFLAAYAVYEAWANRDGEGGWRSGFRIGDLGFGLLPFLLAALLSAFFWLPALAESGAVQIERGTLNGAMLYSNNFLSLAELTAQPRAPVDPDLLNPPVVRALPLAALLLAALALMRVLPALLRRRSPAPSPPRLHLLFFAAAAVVAVVLMLPLARPVWDAVPLLRLTLFPWRLLGPASLFIAMCAGALLSRGDQPSLENWRLGTWPLALAASCLVLAGLPFASPPYEPFPARATLADVAAFEVPPDFVGTTTVGEYLPRAVQQLPADVNARREALMRGEAVPRFEAPGAQVETQTSGPRGDTFLVHADQPVTFIYNQFHFPGWRATRDGQPAPVRATVPDGRLALDLPAGTHTLSFSFADTPPRVVGNWLSVLGLVVLAAWSWSVKNRPGGWEMGHWDLGFRPLLLAAVLLAAARPLLWDAGRTPFLRRGLTADGLRGVAHALDLNFADELTLLGWDAARTSLGADDAFTLDLYWKANRPLGVPYGFDVKLVDEHGRVWSEAETPRPRDWRFTPGTDFWPIDQYILDPYVLTPLAGAPPGVYQARVEVFSRYDLRSLGAARLGPFTLTQPSRRDCADPDARVAGLPGLRSARSEVQAAVPGDEVTLTLCWEVAPGRAPESVQVRLVDGAGVVVLAQRAARESAPASGNYFLRQPVSVRLPAGLETGVYTWTLAGGDVVVRAGALAVAAPARAFEAPPVARRLEADLGPVTLYGADAPAELPAGRVLPVTLIWRADELMDDSYHVFVHLLGPDGGLVAQSDGVPADWARRTTGWLPGEFVVDARTLSAPPGLAPGTYTLAAGLYRPADGARLGTEAWADGRVIVAEWTLD